MPKLEPLATPAQVAEYLQVTPECLRVWAHRKQGPPYVKLSTGTRRYWWHEVHEWLNAQKVEAGQ